MQLRSSWKYIKIQKKKQSFTSPLEGSKISYTGEYLKEINKTDQNKIRNMEENHSVTAVGLFQKILLNTITYMH